MRGDRQRPDEHAEPVARRLQQHGLAVAVDVDLADLGVALAAPDPRPRCRRGSPRAVDVALSATDRPSQSTQRSSDASRRVCAASDSSPPRGHAAYASAPSTSTPSTIQGNQRRTHVSPSPGANATIWSRTCGVDRAELRRDDDARRGRSRTSPAAPGSRSRARPSRPGRTRPASRRSRPSRSCGRRRLRVLAHDPEQHDARVVAGAPRTTRERVVLLTARDAPRVPEVHEHGLAREARRGDRLPVEPTARRTPARACRRAGSCSSPACGSLLTVTREHDGERRRRRRRPRRRSSGTGASHAHLFAQRRAARSAPASAARGRRRPPHRQPHPAPHRRTERDDRAERHQPPADPDPERHRVHRDADGDPALSFGDETIVRYTSSMSPVRTDGVPIA